MNLNGRASSTGSCSLCGFEAMSRMQWTMWRVVLHNKVKGRVLRSEDDCYAAREDSHRVPSQSVRFNIHRLMLADSLQLRPKAELQITFFYELFYSIFS